MRTLLLKFFFSFWLIIAITIGTAGAAGYWYAERLRDAIDSFEISNSMLAASEALVAGGRDGLSQWVRDFPPSRGVTIYVIDRENRELLGRTLPFGMSRSFRRHREHYHESRNDTDDPGNLRRFRPHPQLVAADGAVYTFLVSPSHVPQFIWTSADARLLLFLFAVLVSSIVSYLLAHAISKPVRQLRSATLALADGDLDARVAESVGKRRDELGLLGRDFDVMAKNLQRAAARQTELSRNISHELRSPLARMRVAVELARHKNGEMPEFARLDDEAMRLDELIGQILSYTQMDGNPERDAEPFDLADLMSEVVENVNYECRSEGIEGISVLASVAASPEFTGHARAMTSAIENVLRNAVRHSPSENTVNISLSADAQSAQINIRDHGPGVADEDLGKLFEPFFRTHASVSSGEANGTGLGLAIAERAIRVNGGTITARNHPEGGLEVRISLPL
jgi:signal transduction histidine kinase